jgi:superfamily II DNA helicase RecQ
MKDTAAPPKKRKKKAAAGKKQSRRTDAAKKTPAVKAKESPGGADARVEEALRAWRLGEARSRGVPAFRILTDQALRAIAQTRPASAAELLAIPGIGIGAVEKYGRRIYRIVGEGG